MSLTVNLRKIRDGAVLLIIQDSNNCEVWEPAAVKVCRICLTMDRKLFPIKNHELEEVYQQLTGQLMSADTRLPQQLCSECVQRLRNCNSFRDKCLRANFLMMEILEQHEYLSIENIQTIDPENKHLTSNLIMNTFIDHYDVCINEDIRPTENRFKGNRNFSIETKKEYSIPDSNMEVTFKSEIETYPHNNFNYEDGDSIKDDYYSYDSPFELGNTAEETRNINDAPKIDKRDRLDGNGYNKSRKHIENIIKECFVPLINIGAMIKSKNKTPLHNHKYEDDYTLYDDNSSKDNPPLALPNTNTRVKIDRRNRSYENIFEGDRNCTEEIKEDCSIKISADCENKMAFDKSFNYDDNDIINDDYSSDNSFPTESTNTYTRDETRKTNGVLNIDKIPSHSVDLNEKLFTITDLTVEEQIAEIEKRKESSNYKRANFRCMECYKGFLDENAYNLHMYRHTSECGQYRCKICKSHFRRSHVLRSHIRKIHTQRFSCNQCPFITMNSHTAKLHMRWHNGIMYKCPHCPEQFDKFTTCMSHVRIKHPSDFVCQLCGFSFVSEKGMYQHMQLKHRLKKTVVIPDDGPSCELCNLRFVSTEALQQHIIVSARHINTGKRVYNEYKSRKRLSIFPQNRRNKMIEREFEESIPCEQCGVQLWSSRAYHSHFRRTHPDKNRTVYPAMKAPCMCEICGKIFQNATILKDHRWLHTGERPFSCDVCGKSFRMKLRLMTHKRLHMDKIPMYPCEQCGRQFNNISNKQRHMVVHSDLKPFKCEMCGKSFKQNCERRSHIMYVHMKKPWPKRNRGKRKANRQQLPVEK